MITEVKKRKPRATEKDLEALRQYLVANDQRFFTENKKISTMRKEWNEKHNVNVTPKQFKELRESLQYWKVLKKRPLSRTYSLDEQAWNRIRVWCDRNAGLIAKAESLYVASQLMLNDGLTANPTLLSNSCSFMKFWNARK